MNWKECLENNVKKINPDILRAKSLIETSKERISIINEINQRNSNFVFEDYYTSMIEIIQALAFQKGYNILNHICLGYFIKEVLNKENVFWIFEDLRYKRNSLTYYGKRMDFPIAKHAIKDCQKIIDYLLKNQKSL